MAVEITNNIGPTGANGGGFIATFPTHLDTFGYGGYRVVANQNERLGISGTLSEDRRIEGMAVYQQDTSKLYILTNNPAGTTTTTGDWTEFSGGGGSDLITYDNGVEITPATASYDFTGAGVLVSAGSPGDNITIDIPGGAGPAYNWVIGDGTTSPSNTKTIDATEQVDFTAGNSGIQIILSGASSPYDVSIRNRGSFIISDDEAIPNASTITTGTTGTTVKFIGAGGISTLLNTATDELTISGDGLLPEDLTHNKMWSGDSSNVAYESDILEASNIADSNYVSIIGDPDTGLQIGDSSNPINLTTEVYSHTDSTLIIGKENYGVYNGSGISGKCVVIGTKAVEGLSTVSSSFHNGYVVIGYEACNTLVAGSYIRDSVTIGTQACNAPAGSIISSVTIGSSAGARTGWRDVMIGQSAGSNVLQPASAFPNMAIGYNAYVTGNRGVCLGPEAVGSGNGVAIGNNTAGRLSSDTANVIIGTYAKAGFNSVTIGYQSMAINNSISIGTSAGKYWDDNTGEDDHNTFIGSQAGLGDVSGDSKGTYNIAIGNDSMKLAGYDGADGLEAQAVSRNICIGRESGEVLRSNSNIAIGYYALRVYNQTHYANEGNVVIGDEAAKSLAGSGNGTACNNVMIGSEAGTNLVDGQQNVFIGGQAALAAVESNNIIIGYRAQYGGGTLTGVLSDAIIIGDNAYNDKTGTVSVNSVTIGNNSIGELNSTLVGADSEGAEGGLALGYNANQRNKSSANNASYRNLISMGANITAALRDSSFGDAEAGNGNYCFYNNAEALAGGLKDGDIYVESDGEGSNTPGDPARLCIVLESSS